MDYYGDRTRWFLAMVVSRDDPENLGRVKIRIHGIHTGNKNDIPNKDLPWALCSNPVTEGGVSGVNTTPPGLLPTAQVFGVFLDGTESQIPLVLGTIPKYETAPTSFVKKILNDPDQVTKVSSSPTTTEEIVDQTWEEKILRIQTDTSETVDAKMPGSTNNQKIFLFFKDLGYSQEASVAILGNLIKESKNIAGKNSNKELAYYNKKFNDDDAMPTAKSGFFKVVNGIKVFEGSEGIAQWNPAKAAGYRLQKLKSHASKRNLSYQSLFIQCEYIDIEPEMHTISGYKEVYNPETMKKMTKIDHACIYFEKTYEAPANRDRGSLATGSRLWYAMRQQKIMKAAGLWT